MIKNKLYKYIGINGSITSPILLEGIKSQIFYELRAENGKKLSNGSQSLYVVIVPEEKVDEWIETSGV